MIGVRASGRKKRAEHFEILADFSKVLALFSAYQRIIKSGFCAEFLKIERISAQFLHNFWKFSRPGLETNLVRKLVQLSD